MQEELKTVKEIFGDYKETSLLNDSKIEKINLFKRTNKLEIDLKCFKYIPTKELLEFENYLKARFRIENVEIDTIYDDNVDVPSIEKSWNSIIDYMAYKHPLTKIILKNSKVQVQENVVVVKVFVNGVDFLNARGFDKVLEDVLKNLYGKKYKVKYIEDINEDEIQKLEQKSKMTEKYEIERAISEAQAISEEKEEEPKEETKVEKIPEEVVQQEEKQEEKTPVILGRNGNIKETLVKVSDISIDSGKIALEGEIINTDSRELKSGKVLVMFDLYDGTSTITCKAFVEAEKSKTVLARFKEAKAVRISGTAQFDPFAKEIGVIANVIVEVPAKKKQERMDLAKEKRVELHMHTQMSQMDGMTSATDLIKRAMKWGWKSIAITDHGVVQAFPEAHKLLGRDNPDMKVIYGVEAYLVPDKTPSVSFPKG